MKQQPLMKIVDADGDLYYMEGNDENDARVSFGDDIRIAHGHFVPSEGTADVAD